MFEEESQKLLATQAARAAATELEEEDLEKTR